MPMAALEALDATGRPLMLLFPLFKGKKRFARDGICYDETVALAVFLLYLELLSLPFEKTKEN